jgi:hypothetical protein
MQQAHFDVTNTPADIAAVYPAGTYLAQLAAYIETPHGVLYATATHAPADDADYFRANLNGPLFQFSAGTGTPTWVKTSLPGLTFTLAVARLA